MSAAFLSAAWAATNSARRSAAIIGTAPAPRWPQRPQQARDGARCAPPRRGHGCRGGGFRCAAWGGSPVGGRVVGGGVFGGGSGEDAGWGAGERPRLLPDPSAATPAPLGDPRASRPQDLGGFPPHRQALGHVAPDDEGQLLVLCIELPQGI